MDFLKMSLTELREYAKNKGIRNVSTLKKVELAELLSNVEKMLNEGRIYEFDSNMQRAGSMG